MGSSHIPSAAAYMHNAQSGGDCTNHLQDILVSKLQMPLPPGSLVHRPRLYQRLNEGLHKKLILLSAPAGFGKTSLDLHLAPPDGNEFCLALPGQRG